MAQQSFCIVQVSCLFVICFVSVFFEATSKGDPIFVLATQGVDKEYSNSHTSKVDISKGIVQRKSATFELNRYGVYTLTISHLVFLNKNHAMYSLLESDEVLKELEISDSQKKRIEPIIKLAKKRKVQITNSFAFTKAKGNKETTREFIEWCERARKEFDETTDGILVAHQFNRLEQIERRCAAKRIGLVTFLVSFVEEEFGKIPVARRNKFYKLARELAETKLIEMRKKYKKGLDSILSCLNPTQQRTFSSLVGSESFERVQPEIVISQLVSEQDTAPFDEKRLYREWGVVRVYMFNLDNSVSYKDEAKGDGYGVLNMISEVKDARFDLSSEQQSRLDELMKKVATRIGFGSEKEISLEEFKESEKGLGSYAVQELRMILTTKQYDLVVKRAFRLRCIREGFFNQLSSKYVVSRLKLERKQLERIAKTKRKLHDDLKKQSVRIENDCFSIITKAFETDSNREKLQKAFGKKIKYSFGAISIFLNRLDK